MVESRRSGAERVRRAGVLARRAGVVGWRAGVVGWRAGVLLALALAGVVVRPTPAAAQDRQVRVFLDCQSHGCNGTELRTEIGFVDWVRDATAADVHVIFTSQGTGAGTRFILDFIGRGALDGFDLEIPQDVPATATSDERLRLVTSAFRAGLLPYVARSGYADRLEIRDPGGAATAVRMSPADDPWDHWVFRVGSQVEGDGEEREQSWELSGSMSANRTTPEWKIETGVNGRFYHRAVELNDGDVFVNETRDWGVALLAVNSLSPRWSAGSEIEASRSTRRNRKLGGRTALALEWNLYPYAEANRRQLLFHYQLGASRVEYQDSTIFDRIEETLFDHRLVGAYQTRQPWGDASVSIQYSSFLDDFSKFRLASGANLSVRLFRGLDLDLRGGYDIIRDQIYLPKEELSDEEILVQRRALATGYEYRFDVGLSYRFGSIFNNVVNNRFPWVVRNFD